MNRIQIEQDVGDKLLSRRTCR